jgi:FAD:protein FMN transferase
MNVGTPQCTPARRNAGFAWVQIGPLLRDAIALAIRAAHVTDGAVDPTLGRDLIELGYDRDWHELDASLDDREDRPRAPRARRCTDAWRLVELDDGPASVRCPRGMMLDLERVA